jgi:hypothetical protein
LIHHRFITAVDGIVGAIKFAVGSRRIADEAAIDPSIDLQSRIVLWEQEPAVARTATACVTTRIAAVATGHGGDTRIADTSLDSCF